MGEVIKIQEVYNFTLPDISAEDRILFTEKSKKDQYWRREPLPNFKRLSEREKMEYINRERDRCFFTGVYFMNNGKKEYLTPFHYFYLQWCKMDAFDTEDGYPTFWKAHQDYLFFKQIVWDDDNCYGADVIKPRRAGFTSIEIAYQLWVVLGAFERHVAELSKDEETVFKTQFEPLINTFLKLPKEIFEVDFYKPSGRKPTSELLLDSKKLNTKKTPLGGWIRFKPLTMKAFDGDKLHYITLDEIFKWTSADPYETFKVHKACLETGGIIRGKMTCLSTVGENDELYAKAVAAAIKMWNESNPAIRLANGQTMSGLYRFFISAPKIYEKYIDKYGYCDEEKALAEILAKRSAYEEGSPDWIAEVRRFPITVEEVFASTSKGNAFPKIRLSQRQNEIHQLPPDDKPYVRGKLVEGPDGLVSFEPSSEGNWLIAELPHERAQNRYSRRGGFITPYDDSEYVEGLDPIRYKDTTSENVSENAIVIWKKYDYYRGNNVQRNFPAAIFCTRTDTPQEGYDEAVKACKFYGCKAMIERQVIEAINYFFGKSMGEFVMKSPYDGLPGIWSAAKSLGDGIDKIVTWLRKAKPNSDIPEERIDYVTYIMFEKMCSQLIDFDPAKTTKFDLVMALMMALFGAAQLKERVVEQDNSYGAAQVALDLFSPVRS